MTNATTDTHAAFAAGDIHELADQIASFYAARDVQIHITTSDGPLHRITAGARPKHIIISGGGERATVATLTGTAVPGWQPSRNELNDRGMTAREIAQIMAERRENRVRGGLRTNGEIGCVIRQSDWHPA